MEKLIRIDEQTDLNELKEKGVIKHENLLNELIAKQKLDKKKKGEEVSYLTTSQLQLTTLSSRLEILKEKVTDTYEFFQGTKLEENLENTESTENLQNVAEMIDDFSDNILFTSDNPIINRNDLTIFHKKNLVTGLSLKISDLIGNNKEIGDEIKKISNGSLLSIAGTALSGYFNKTFSDNIEQYRTNLEGLNNVPQNYFEKPEDVKSTIDQLMENHGVFDSNKFKKVNISDIKEIGNLLGTNLINGEIANNVSAIAEVNSGNSNLGFEDKAKLFFNSSMGSKIKDFFKNPENSVFAGIISFLLTTFMGIDLDKLMESDKLDEKGIVKFRESIVDGDSIKNADKLFKNNKGEEDIATANRLYGIKQLGNYSDDKYLKDVFYDVVGKDEFQKIKDGLTGKVLDSNNAITDNMDKTINYYYDYLSEKSRDDSLTIESFINSKKEAEEVEAKPTPEKEVKKWEETVPTRQGDKIIAITGLGNYKYKTIINKDATIIVESEIGEKVKYRALESSTEETLKNNWDKLDLTKIIDKKDIIESIGKILSGKDDGKFNNSNEINLGAFTFTKVELSVVGTVVAAGTVASVAKTESPKTNDTDEISKKDVKDSNETENKADKLAEEKEPKIEKETNEEILEKQEERKKEEEKQVQNSSETVIEKTYLENTCTIDSKKYITRVDNKGNINIKTKSGDIKYRIDSTFIIKVLKSQLNSEEIKKDSINEEIPKFLKSIIENGKINAKEEITLTVSESDINLKLIEDGRKKEKDKIENTKKPNKTKIEKKDPNIQEKSKVGGRDFIKYFNVLNSISGKLGEESFTVSLKKGDNNPFIEVKLGDDIYKNVIIEEKGFSVNSALSWAISDDFNISFDKDSNISVDSDAISLTSDVDFKISISHLIGKIKNNESYKLIPWENSPKPGTKMYFKKVT